MSRVLTIGPPSRPHTYKLQLVGPGKFSSNHVVLTGNASPVPRPPKGSATRRNVLFGVGLLHGTVVGETGLATRVLIGMQDAACIREVFRVVGPSHQYLTTVYDARLAASATDSRFLCLVKNDSGVLTGHMYSRDGFF